jgi:hypothetical protein
MNYEIFIADRPYPCVAILWNNISNLLRDTWQKRTYSETDAAVTGVIRGGGQFHGEFEGATMAITIVGLGVWI